LKIIGRNSKTGQILEGVETLKQTANWTICAIFIMSIKCKIGTKSLTKNIISKKVEIPKLRSKYRCSNSSLKFWLQKSKSFDIFWSKIESLTEICGKGEILL